jgi:hypothetical protein
MTIVVLNYATTEVVIHKDVDMDFIDSNYEGNVESYLVEEYGYNADEIYYMCGDEVRLKYV